MNKNTVIKSVNTLARYSVFIFFALLCFSYISTSFKNLSQLEILLLGPILIIITIITWQKTHWLVYGIPVCIPIISVIQRTNCFSHILLLSLLFSTFYLAWFLKQLFLKKSLESPTGIGVFTDLLAALIITSLIASLWTIPFDLSLHQLFWSSFPRQISNFFYIENAYCMLLGLFYFRIIELESIHTDARKRVKKTLYLQTLVIIILYFTQPLFLATGLSNHSEWLTCFPFEDIHSYGSCLILLFFTILGIKNKKLISVTLSCVLLLMIFLTGSRITLLVLLFVSLFYLGFHYSTKRKLFAIVLSIGLIFVIAFSGTILNNIKSNKLTIIRNSMLLTPKKFFMSSTVQVRLALWQRALNMVKQHPLAGTGIGSYHSVSLNYQDRTNKRFRTFKENTHNYYLQIASELGVLALLLWLSIIIISFKRGLRYLSFGTDNKEKDFIYGLLFGLAAYLLTMLTGHPLLLISQQLFFWFYVAILAIIPNFITIRGTDNRLIRTIENKYKYFTCLIILLLGGLFFWSYAYQTPGPEKYGFYNFESHKDKSGKPISFVTIWTRKEAQVNLPAASDILRLHITASGVNSSLPEGLQLNLFVNDQLLDSVHFINGGNKTLSYYVPGIKNTEIILKLQVNRTFNPYLLGKSSDNRDLGVFLRTEINFETKDFLYNGLPLIEEGNTIVNKTAYIRRQKNWKINFPINLFLNRLPLEGTGLYQKEKWDANALPEGFNDNPAEVCWTGMRASIPLPKQLEAEGGQIFLRAIHPDIQQNNVQMKMLADDRVIREETFSDYSWKKLSFSPEDLADTEILTFQVSRTWNPKLSGLSEDTRDLGIAVFIPK